MNINKIITEEFNNLLKEFKLKEFNHSLTHNLFDDDNVLNENDQELRDQVIFLIKNNQWEPQNPKSFRESLLKSKHPDMLTDYSESELSDMKLFKLKNFNIGYALKTNQYKPYSEIVAVHNNEPDVKNIGGELMQSAINNGGCYLDHFDSEKLSSLYKSMGFEEYDRDMYNSMYDPTGSFKNKYGELDVIYRKHKNC